MPWAAHAQTRHLKTHLKMRDMRKKLQLWSLEREVKVLEEEKRELGRDKETLSGEIARLRLDCTELEGVVAELKGEKLQLQAENEVLRLRLRRRAWCCCFA